MPFSLLADRRPRKLTPKGKPERMRRNRYSRLDHKQLRDFFDVWLVSLGMNAVGGTNVHAEMIFCAGIGNYVCHILKILS